MDLHPDVEIDAAQALFAARMLEAAAHDNGPWTFRWGGIEIPAERVLADDGVHFSGTFPDVCWLDRPTDGLTILLRGEVMGIRRIDEVEHPGDTGFVVSWAVISRRARVSG
jgi:hypothetical protein